MIRPTWIAASVMFVVVAMVTWRLSGAENAAERWEDEIRAFESLDSELAPPPGGILFVGSSSIRLWDLREHLPQLNAVNRGFGGSQMSDLVYYVDRIVIRYQPRVIVVYEGDNDIASGHRAEDVLAEFRKFSEQALQKLPECRIIFLSIKPSIARWQLYPEMQKVNKGLVALCATEPRCQCLDVGSALLGADGTPRRDLYEPDGLHLNDKGYEIWDPLVLNAIKSLK